jgi:SagB-type dehydrogenase family enzyme
MSGKFKNTVLISMFFSNVLMVAQTAGDIRLLPPMFAKETTLYDALKNRKSERSFADADLSIQQLSNLLWAAAGVNREDSGKRTAPTAHNDQEIDVYAAMQTGLYLYNAKDHILEKVLDEDIRSATGNQEFVKDAALNLIYVADFRRAKGDAESKAFYSATDTGFISQNVYLYCAAEGLATVVRGWVDREKLAEKMQLHPEQQIILTQTVGLPK